MSRKINYILQDNYILIFILKQNQMKTTSITIMIHWVLFASLLMITTSVQCNGSNYQFMSNYSLGIQNELNVTFTKIQDKMQQIPDVEYVPKANYKYTISNFKLKYLYLDSTQTGEVIGNNSILVKGGKVRVEYDFTWKLTGLFGRNGTASGNGISDPIIFGKDLIINSEGFPMFNLFDWYNITFYPNFTITRMDPYSDDDFTILTTMLNKFDNGTSVKDYILNGTNTVLPFYLNESLHDEQQKLERYRNYTWTDTDGSNFTVTFQHFLLQVDLERSGLNLLYSTAIKDYDGYVCGKPVPHDPLDPSVYGGTQQFNSLGVYFSTVQYALQKGLFHTDLNQDNWQSNYFQFYVGDLYDAIPVLTKKFIPSQKLLGSCIASKNLYNLTRGGYDFFNVTIYFNCNLGTAKSKIVDMSVKAIFQVQGIPQATYLDFIIKNAIFTATYNQYQDYKVENTAYADFLLQSTVQQLIGQKTFGSGFKAYTRDYPHFQVWSDWTVIYDSSHVPGTI